MAKLTRVFQKFFGSASAPTQISVFGSLAAGSPAYSTNPATIQSLSNFLVGWFGASVGANSPAEEDMNALFFLVFYQIAYLMQAGIAEWDASTTYYIGSLAQDGAGNIYISLQDNNTNHALTDSTYWILYNGSIRDVSTTATASASDNLIRANTTSAAFTISLPAVASTPVGKRFTFKLIAGLNPLTVQGHAFELIDGSNTISLSVVYDAVTIENNGTSWDVIASNPVSQVIKGTGSGSYSNSGSSLTNVCSVAITSAPGPVFITLEGDGLSSNTFIGATGSGPEAKFVLLRDGTPVARWSTDVLQMPSLTFTDNAVTPGSHTYTLQGALIAGSGFAEANNVLLVASQ